MAFGCITGILVVAVVAFIFLFFMFASMASHFNDGTHCGCLSGTDDRTPATSQDETSG
jgi:hypothetical protein